MICTLILKNLLYLEERGDSLFRIPSIHNLLGFLPLLCISNSDLFILSSVWLMGYIFVFLYLQILHNKTKKCLIEGQWYIWIIKQVNHFSFFFVFVFVFWQQSISTWKIVILVLSHFSFLLWFPSFLSISSKFDLDIVNPGCTLLLLYLHSLPNSLSK